MINRTVKRLAAIAATGMIAIGLTVSTTEAASATPGGCTTGWASDGVARGVCSSGSGQMRIGIPCKAIWTLGYGYTQYSTWVGVDQVAYVSCPSGAWLWTDIQGGPQIILEKRN